MDGKMKVVGAENKLEIGLEHCRFENVNDRESDRAFVQSKGVFFTDSCFRLQEGDGPARQVQFEAVC